MPRPRFCATRCLYRPIMERINNAIADPAINPTMNDLETGRFHA
jgi:hypothetical protein